MEGAKLQLKKFDNYCLNEWILFLSATGPSCALKRSTCLQYFNVQTCTLYSLYRIKFSRSIFLLCTRQSQFQRIPQANGMQYVYIDISVSGNPMDARNVCSFIMSINLINRINVAVASRLQPWYWYHNDEALCLVAVPIGMCGLAVSSWRAPTGVHF